METSVVRLAKTDYDEVVDFLNMVFSMNSRPHNFPVLLPALYQRTEESMGCHWAIRQKGRIQAVVGVYPTNFVLGGTDLKLARIGAVSTHPNARGQGLMSTLFRRVNQEIQEEEYDLAWLGGLRHRYLHFGYEKAGSAWIYTFNKNNLKYLPQPEQPIQFERITHEKPTLIQKLLAFHNKQASFCTRSEVDFFAYCSHWHHKLLAAYGGEELVGYLVVDQNEAEISESAAVDGRTQLDMLAAFVHRTSTYSVRVRVNPLNLPFVRLLEEYAEDVEMSISGNWQILNWEKVIEASLRAKSQIIPLDDGVILLEIENYGTVEVGVEGLHIYCVPVEKKGVIALDTPHMTRLLFGPHHPQVVISLPAEAEMLKNWCPLPLYLSRQDFA